MYSVTPRLGNRIDWIWKIPCNQKLKFFIWLAIQNKLATNQLRKIRKMIEDSACVVCANVDESVVHILRDCKAARKIWQNLLKSAQLREFLNSREESWLHKNQVSKSSCCVNFPLVPWSMIFVASIWFIWKAINFRVFNGKEENPSATMFQIKTLVHDLMSMLKLRSGTSNITWTRPTKGWVKLNIDGRVLANNNSGAAGGVLSDEKGAWIWGFVTTIPQPKVLEAEIEAIRIGLSIAWEKRVPRIEIETDSSDAYSLISRVQIGAHPLMKIIEECQILLRKPWEYKFRWIARSENRLADAVVKLPSSSDGEVNMLHFPPISVFFVLEDDVA